MSEEIIFSAEQRKHVPVTLAPSVPQWNPKATEEIITVYTSLRKEKKEGWRDAYVTASSRGVWKYSFTAPEGAIVRYYYRSGSHKHALFRTEVYFLVREGAEGTVTLPNEVGENHATAEVKNLVPLEKPTDEELAQMEAELLNKYQAKPSQYAPVRTLYYFWVKKGLWQLAPPAPTPVPATEEEEPAPPQLSLQLATAAPQPVAPATTAVATASPAAVAAEEAEAPATPSLVKEAESLLREELRARGYREARLLVFDLPTEYQGVTTKTELTDEGLVERKVLPLDKVAEMRTLRRSFYAVIEKYAARTKAGWLILTDDVPAELEAYVEKINGVRPGSAEIITIIVSKDFLEREVHSWEKRLEATVSELAKRLADDAVSAAMRRRLQRKKREIEEALTRTRAFLAALAR